MFIAIRKLVLSDLFSKRYYTVKKYMQQADSTSGTFPRSVKQQL